MCRRRDHVTDARIQHRLVDVVQKNIVEVELTGVDLFAGEIPLPPPR
jgi:hypothetical protein